MSGDEKEKKEEDENNENDHGCQENECPEPEPLMPSDPSAALLRCQGHYLIHLSFLIAAHFFTTADVGPFHCLEHK